MCRNVISGVIMNRSSFAAKGVAGFLFLALLPFFCSATALAGEPKKLSALTGFQKENLRILDIEPLKACPGDTLLLKITTFDEQAVPPMLMTDVAATPVWAVRPDSGIVLDSRSGRLVVGRNVRHGSLYELSATLGKYRVYPNRLYVYTKAGNPFVGTWTDMKEEVLEFILSVDGRFSVTFQPFEAYRDFWGEYRYDPEKRHIVLTVTGGNSIPLDRDLEGGFFFDAEGLLHLENIFFGTHNGRVQKRSGYIFRKS